MREDRFRVAGRTVEIQRTQEAAKAGPMPGPQAGFRAAAGMRGRREIGWQILVGRQRIGVAHRSPSGLYVCGRFAERDLRRLACRLMGESEEALEDIPAS
jgi:hypothetical protein